MKSHYINQNLRNTTYHDEDDIDNMLIANLINFQYAINYSKKKSTLNKYFPYCFDEIQASAIKLARCGLVDLIEYSKGVYIYERTPKLFNILKETKTTNVYKHPIFVKQNKDLAWTPQGEKKIHLDYVDVTFEPAQSNLIKYNEYMCHQYLTDNTGKRYETKLKRVFNNTSIDHGGRFYCAKNGYQDLAGSYKENRQLRSNLLINNQKTIELDYEAVHPTILSLRDGYHLIGDPYLVNDEIPRSTIKYAWNVALNASSIDSCIHALENKGVGSKEYIEYVLEIIKKDMHPALTGNLFSGHGIVLQNWDSKIAENVMLNMINIDIPVLCIHDSFITYAEKEDVLKQIMIESFQKVLNTSYVPKIK